VTLLGHRKGIRPVKSWVLVCCWWWFDWSFTRLTSVVVTTTSIILSFNKHWLTQAHWEKRPSKRRERERERETGRQTDRQTETACNRPESSDSRVLLHLLMCLCQQTQQQFVLRCWQVRLASRLSSSRLSRSWLVPHFTVEDSTRDPHRAAMFVCDYSFVLLATKLRIFFWKLSEKFTEFKLHFCFDLW